MLENIRQRWSDSSTGIRAGSLIGLLAILLLFAGMIYWVMRDTYQVLFSDLDPQDATTIVSELDKMKVPYRLEEGGKAIMVAEEAVYKTRLKLMGKGVNLRGTVGFEIFNTTDFGTTEFAQKINYQRALQGELARTIMDFEEIKFARVHLVMPESGLFKKSNVKPKASISLIMKGDRQLSAEQVTGIQRLVAASVPEIDPASVTVIDQRGVALSRKPDTEGEADMPGVRLEAKKQVEAYLTRKIVDMLDKVVGDGQAIVSVDAALTQDHVKVTREDVIPFSHQGGVAAGAIVRRRQSGQHQEDAMENVAGAKLPDASGASPGRETPWRPAGTLEVEYQNGRKIEQSVSTPGNIKRISVGVLLPDTVTAEQIEKIREVVAMAAGITRERGDSLAIYSIEQFAAKVHQAPSPAAAADAVMDRHTSVPAAGDGSVVVIRGIAMLLGAAGLLAVGFAALSRRRKIAPGSMAPAQMSEAERRQALLQMRHWLDGDSHVPQAEMQR